MPSITLSRLSAATPEGRPILSDINISFGPERAGLVGRNGVGKTTLLKLVSSEIRPVSGQIQVSGTIGFMKQMVQIGEHETVADLFGATDALAMLSRAEAGEAGVDELAETDWTIDERLAGALARVGLDALPETLLMELSGGQRTRASLAAAIFGEPDFLLLDEPTNNLDDVGRQAVLAILSNWRKGAIVVSHDRELLEEMDAIIELTSLGIARYGGNWSHYRERKAVELAAAQQDLAQAERKVVEVNRQTQLVAERKSRRDGAGKRKGAQRDMPRILAGARKNSAESSGGDGARRAERQRSDALQAAASARDRVERLQALSIVLPPTGLTENRTVLSLKNVYAGYDDARPILRDLSYTMVGPRRLAVSGQNGSGKTTLMKLIDGQIEPISGTVSVKVPSAMLDQEVAILDERCSILDNFRRLNPDSSDNACRAALAGFLFRADAALQKVGELSGGQVLRAGLACVLGGPHPPQLLILDEPTNHLDMDSIDAIESALTAFDGALVVVSHDERFLANIGIDQHLEISPRR
jgi:ATPase subunit of ABC transporter with duplicated ATPase domains